MANEAKCTASINATKGGASITKTVSASFSMAGMDMLAGTQNFVHTSGNAVNLGAITGTPQMVLIANLDTANYIELATDAGMVNKFSKILAGGFALLPPSGTIYIQANTATVPVFVGAFEA